MSYITYNKNTKTYTVQYYGTNNYYPVYEFILSIKDRKLQSKTMQTITLLENNGYNLRMPHSKYLQDGIYELRTKQGSNITRILYFFDENRIILTNGFIKKEQKTPKQEINIAIKNRKIYFERSK